MIALVLLGLSQVAPVCPATISTVQRLDGKTEWNVVAGKRRHNLIWIAFTAVEDRRVEYSPLTSDDDADKRATYSLPSDKPVNMACLYEGTTVELQRTVGPFRECTVVAGRKRLSPQVSVHCSK